jgi:hypothetical protein
LSVELKVRAAATEPTAARVVSGGCIFALGGAAKTVLSQKCFQRPAQRANRIIDVRQWLQRQNEFCMFASFIGHDFTPVATAMALWNRAGAGVATTSSRC